MFLRLFSVETFVSCVQLINFAKITIKTRIRNEGYLDLEDMTEIVYRYSRELEHSDENLELFEMMMEKTKIFV